MKIIDTGYISENVADIFGEDNIAAAFITGGIASGYGSEHCDIDILVCHRDEVNTRRREHFTKFYLDLHQQLRRIPDEISPGEVMSVEGMYTGLDRVNDIEPARVVHDRNDFDYICWAGMLVSKKELLIPRTSELTNFEVLGRKVVDRWCDVLFEDVELTDETGLRTDKDKMLGKAISCPGYYEAHE